MVNGSIKALARCFSARDRERGEAYFRRGSVRSAGPVHEVTLADGHRAAEIIGRIRALGGVVPAIKENFFQREIADASFRYQSEVEAKQRIIVGEHERHPVVEPAVDVAHMTGVLQR